MTDVASPIAPPPPLSSSPPPPAPSSRPAPMPRPAKLCLALVVSAYLAYSAFGIAAPFLWGHHGYHGATYGQRARMTLRLHVVTPATSAGWEIPNRGYYYLHHPIGYHHLIVPFLAVFGEKEWVVRAVAAAGGLFALWALVVLVRRWWSAWAAVLAAAVYVALPIVCSFSVLSDPMLLEMALCIVCVDRFQRYLQSPTRRDLAIACAAYAAGGLLMWEAYFEALFLGVAALVWSLASSRGRQTRLGRFNAGRLWFFATGLASSAAMAFHFGYTWAIGMMDDFLSSYRQRHEGGSATQILSAHERWLDLLYGKPLQLLGAAWLAVFLARLATGRARARDAALLLFFTINTVYIAAFPQASSVHMYRVFFYSTFLALAVTDLIVDLGAVIRIGVRKLGANPTIADRAGPLAAVLAAAAFFAVQLPHSYRNLVESREMMGTHGLAGYNPDYEKQLFAMEAVKRVPERDWYLTFNLAKRVEFNWYLDRNDQILHSLSQLPAAQKQYPRARAVVMDVRLPEPERARLLDELTHRPGVRYGDYLLLDLKGDQPDLREYKFVAQPMSRAWRFLYSHKYPPMAAVPVLTTLGECVWARANKAPPADLPEPVAPTTGRAEDAVCHHDYELLRGRDDAARAFREKLEATLDRRDGAIPGLGRVLGLKQPKRTGAELWFLAEKSAPTTPARAYRVRVEQGATVVATAPLGGPNRTATSAVPGGLRVEPLRFSVPPGTYHLVIEEDTGWRPPLRESRAPIAADLGAVELR